MSSVTNQTPVPVPDKHRYLKITVEIAGQVYVEDLDAQLAVLDTPEGLSQALGENPQRFAWWATLENAAEKQKTLLENQLDKVKLDRKEAVLRVESRLHLEFSRDGGKVDEIKAKVAIHPDRLKVWDEWAKKEFELRDRLAEVTFEYNGLRTGRKSFQDRKDSLIEKCRLMRDEMGARLNVRGDSRMSPGEALERMNKFFDPNKRG